MSEQFPDLETLIDDADYAHIRTMGGEQVATVALTGVTPPAPSRQRPYEDAVAVVHLALDATHERLTDLRARRDALRREIRELVADEKRLKRLHRITAEEPEEPEESEE